MVGLAAVATLAFAACSSSGTSSAPSAARRRPPRRQLRPRRPPGRPPHPGDRGRSSEELIAAAKAEGGLTTIALPHDWVRNYGEVLTAFTTKYGIPINELDAVGRLSGAEIEAIKANVNNPGPQNPDVVDVGFAFGDRTRTSSFRTRSRPGHDRTRQGGRRVVGRRLLRRHVVRE
jgi:hypothetical protein